ncbi:MAG: LytTR family DNA-binding domain-containing protein, partial [Bacteroidota bacterium]
IFCTAYDTYAVEAFEAGAVDYLLKPYTQARFRKAMDRVLKRLQDPPDPARLAALAQQAQPPNTGYLERLFVRAGDRVLPVDVQNVLWVEAAGDYARLHTAEAPYLTSLRLSTLAERLDPDRFVRVHRSSIVALPAIQHLTSDGDGGYVLTLTNRKRVRVSRSYAPVIRDLIT